MPFDFSFTAFISITVTKLTFTFLSLLLQCFTPSNTCTLLQPIHTPGTDLLFPPALYTPPPFSSTEKLEMISKTLNISVSRLNRQIPACLPAVLLSVFTSTGSSLHRVEQCLCVFSSHCINLHQLHTSQHQYAEFPLLYNVHFCS